MIYNKVAFVNPPTIEGSPKMIRTFDCNTESKGNYLYQPYDFVVMSGLFDKSVEIFFCDAVAEGLLKSEAVEVIERSQSEVLFVVIGENLFDHDIDFLHELRKKNEERPILVFGAPFVERAAQQRVEAIVDGILQNPISFDLKKIKRHREGLITGEGFVTDESPFLDPRRKAAKEVSLGTPRHEDFLSPRYRWPFAESYLYTSVFISWGCPYSCSYCILNSFPNLVRKSEEVIRELEFIKNLGVKEIYFADRSFGLPRETVVEILRLMIERKMEFRWSSYFHPNQYDPELFDLMVKSGCHTLIIGVESKDFNSLKSFGRHQKEQRFWALLEDCKKRGVKVCGDFIIGLPNQTKEEIEETIIFSRRIGLDFASFNVAAPLPGSIVKKIAINSGQLEAGGLLYDSLAKYKALSNGVLSGEELVALRKKAVIKFYLRPSYLIKRVFSIKSWQQFVIQFGEMIQIIKKVG